ncbi:MAG TPA: WD40 repeat domain-containing protein [Ktedonobacterales bacterium]
MSQRNPPQGDRPPESGRPPQGDRPNVPSPGDSPQAGTWQPSPEATAQPAGLETQGWVLSSAGDEYTVAGTSLPTGMSAPSALPAPAEVPLLPAPAQTPALPSATPPALLPPGPAPAKRFSRQGMLLATILIILVFCAAPLWFFGLWSGWFAHSHQPPPVLTTLDPQGHRADMVSWSPDGRFLTEQVTFNAGTDVTQATSAVVLWDMTTEQEVRRFPGLFSAAAMAWSPDGAWLATSDGNTVLIWAAAQVEGSGNAVAPMALISAPASELGITGLAWSKDGKTLATVGEGGLTIWQSADGVAWQKIQGFGDQLCSLGVCDRALLWSPDGKWLLASPWHNKDGLLGVGAWNAQTWEQQPLLDASAPLAWSPDSSLVLVRSSNETTLAALQPGSWAPAWTLNPNPDLHQRYSTFPQAAVWSPDGKWLVGAADGWVDLWHADTRQSVWVWNEQHTDQGIYTVNSLAWSPDGTTLAVVTDGTAQITLYDLHDPDPPIGVPAPLG